MARINISHVNQQIESCQRARKWMDRYDAFVDQLKALGIKEVLTVRQAMYDRFLAR